MMAKVSVFTKLKKIKKYVYDPETNLFRPELDEQGQEKDGYELYPDHRHDGYNKNYNGGFSDDHARIQNNPLTKFLILGDFDKNFKAESMIENWHGMSYESKISRDAQFLCNDENLNLIISEGFRFLEIGWKYRNDNNNKLLHRCDNPEKDRDIYIDLSNIVDLLFYASEIRRLPYKQGEPIKKYGSPETKVKITEENAIKLMKEVYRQSANVSDLLGKAFSLFVYNALCRKIFETESELKKCQSEWSSVVYNLNNKISYGKDEKGQEIIDKLTDVDELKKKYNFKYDIPFGQNNNKGNVQDYCIWDNISQNNQNKLIEIDKRQQPLKKALDKLNVQKQNTLNQILSGENHTQKEKRIEQLTKLLNIKSNVDKMILSQISGNVKIDDNNPIQVIKNVMPQIDNIKKNIEAPQTKSQVKLNEEKENKNPEIDHENDENIQNQSVNSLEIIKPDENVLNKIQEKNLIQNHNEIIKRNKENADVPQTETQVKLNEEEENKNLEIDHENDENVQDQDINHSEVIQANNNVLHKSQGENLIQNNNEVIELNENIIQNLNEITPSTETIIQLSKASEDTGEKLNGDNGEVKNKTNSESEKETNEKLEDSSKEAPEQKISSETKQDDNSDIRKELSTMMDEYQSSMVNKRQEDRKKRKERANEFQKFQNIDIEVAHEIKTFNNNVPKDKGEKHVEPEQKIDENDQGDSKRKKGNGVKSKITQTDSKNSADNIVVHFFKWLINKIRSWFGYPELWQLNNIKTPDEINSANPEKNQKLQNENPKLEELSQGPNKQNKGI